MKLFKYLIYAFVVIIVVCLIVLIIQPEQSQVLRTESTKSAKPQDNRKSLVSSAEKPTEPEIIIPSEIQSSLTPEQFATLPAFLQALPKKPSEVDSNGNDIRDDIEVYIGFKFPYQPKQRAVLIQMYNVIDKIAKERGKGRISQQYSILLNEKNAEKCWENSGFTDTELNQFKAMILNNNYRTNAYAATLEVRQSLDQDIIESLKVSDKPCDIMLKEYQMSLQEWEPDAKP